MTVRILFFGALRELMGRNEQSLELGGAQPTVTDALACLTRQEPRLRERLAAVRVACNETFVDRTSELTEGDVVALIPPVAGG